MQNIRARYFSFFLIVLLPGCSPMGGMGMGALNPLGSTPNPAGALLGASQDCEGMALVLADPAQPAFLKEQVRQAMVAGGCL